MPELIVSLHMHTFYSDGNKTHAGIAESALKTDVDVVIVTDHNVFVAGMDAYHQKNSKRVLLIVGEEVHDANRYPQKNHLLVFGADREVASYASDPQKVIDQVQQSQGLAFIAHPFEKALPAFGEDDIGWIDWSVKGFTGMELWNNLSELKERIGNRMQAIFYAYFPEHIARGPRPEALAKWDEMTGRGMKVVAIGGVDAHAMKVSMGPFRRVLFPYEWHFRCINTHIIVPRELGEDLPADRRMVLNALRNGNAFIGYDLPQPTRGFSFTGRNRSKVAQMGEEIDLEEGVTLQVRTPARVKTRLIKDGQIYKEWDDRELLALAVNQPGVYRVECYIDYLGRNRGWIFSNPIYVVKVSAGA